MLLQFLTPDVKARYETLFHALWRSKRMEWIMSKLRHQQLTDGRKLRGLPGHMKNIFFSFFFSFFNGQAQL